MCHGGHGSLEPRTTPAADNTDNTDWSDLLPDLYDGQPVPADADPAHLENLADLGYVAEGNEPGAVPAESGPVKPAGNASFDEWSAYAVETGQATADDLKGMSRNELRELYG